MNKNKIVVAVVLVILAIFFVFTTCYRSGDKSKARELPPGTHGVSVIEAVQTSNYTYLQVEENKNKFWIAVVRREAKPGDSVYYSQAYEMKGFVSKELGRTFPSVFFVQDPWLWRHLCIKAAHDLPTRTLHVSINPNFLHNWYYRDWVYDFRASKKTNQS